MSRVYVILPLLISSVCGAQVPPNVGGAAPRPAIVLEQPARLPANPSLTASAERGKSPGLKGASLLSPERLSESAASAEAQRIQDTATILNELPKSGVLYVGQMLLIKAGAVSRVAIGNGKVISARTVDDETLLITALDAGDSTLHVWSKNGVLKKSKIRVNIADNDRVIEEMRDLTSGMPGVTIRRVGEKIVLDGSGLDPGALTRLETLVKLYPQIVNLATADRIRIDRMVDIQVRIMEFNKTALDDLGVKWQESSNGFTFGLFSDISAGGNYRIIPSDSPFAEITGFGDGTGRRVGDSYLGLAASLSSRINLLVQRGNAFLLASPNLTTRSGGEAKFLAGGEIPLPAIGAFGGGSVDFKSYGVLLNIKPIADGEGNIAGNILTEVSSIDRSVAVQGIPGLLTRRTDSEFNVKDGETIILSGLISRESARNSDGLPGLRKLPFFGRAFRSDNDSDRESEVVVFITPRVVNAGSSRARIEKAQQRETELSKSFGRITEERAKPAPVQTPEPVRAGGRMHPDDGP